MATLAATALVAMALQQPVFADSLSSINHVVLFMQENRAFDHYFGTMAGVRGFSDPNVQVNNGKSVFLQDVDASLSKANTSLAPWYLNYLGGTWEQATQCMVAGDNGYNDNHAAYNEGLNNKWAVNNTPWSWAHFRREELPIHFAIAEGWTVGDMYQQSVIASTDPNRISWISGSINCPGGPQSPDQGGVMLDNNETPGCEGPDLNCYPLKWETYPEYLQAANVTWQVYQNTDNFDDNPLAWFQQFQQAKPGSALYDRGNSFQFSLDDFYAQAQNGTLPQVSYIIGPAELSEHPPYQPKDGAWLQRQVVEAVTTGASYKDTVLMISYDETGGWGDHVVPFHSPEGTAGEWLEDPYHVFGETFTGPGFRLPFYIISPWTRGGNVYVENADHSSQIKFVETWLASKGINATTTQIPAWRRANMADLTKAFDFAHPDLSLPTIPQAETPSTNSAGAYDGYALCEAAYPTQRPPVPYTNQTAANTFGSEQGFKLVRGQLTEGRYLTFESGSFALANAKGKLTASRKSASHNTKAQRFVLHQVAVPGNKFTISSALDGSYLTSSYTFSQGASKAMQVTINDLGSGRGQSIQDASGKYITVSGGGVVQRNKVPVGFQTYSVTYGN